MLYYRSKARENAINEIKSCMYKISEIHEDELSHIDAAKTIRFLSMLIDVIEREERDAKRK